MILSHSERSITVERDIVYNVRLQGQGSPLLLLHGFTGSAESWAGVAEALASSHTLIMPDLLGHGRTSAPPDAARYAIDHAAADLVAVLDALGVEQAGLHGYSMGGRLALYTALAHPSRFTRLSLESASPGLAAEHERSARRASDDALAARILDHGIEAFVDTWEQLPLFASQLSLPDDVRARQRQQRLANAPLGLANSLRGMGTGEQPNLWPRLAELRMPVLLLTGTLDAKFTRIADEMAASLSQAQRITVPDCGHTVYLEQPAAWLDAVRGFHST